MIRPIAIGALILLATCGTISGVNRPGGWKTRLWQPVGISSAEFESHPAFDRANRTIYFVRSSSKFKGWRIFESRCRAGRWSDPRPAEFAGKGVEADPFLTPDGKKLFFISTRNEDGVTGRGLDLWRTERPDPASSWSRPVRLPEPVNSAGNEWFPRLARDGWLYFGSDRAGGLGATDIYRTRQFRGAWKIENLGPGVNGAGDEYEAEISSNGRRMILMADGDLFLVRREGDQWGKRTKLGPEINTPGMEVGPLLSPSGRAMLFARDFGDTRLPSGGSGELVVASLGADGRWPAQCN